MGQTREQRVINQITGRPTEQKFTPIASDMFLPNHSGDHSAGIVKATPTSDLDIANKKYVDDQIAAIPPATDTNNTSIIFTRTTQSNLDTTYMYLNNNLCSATRGFRAGRGGSIVGFHGYITSSTYAVAGTITFSIRVNNGEVATVGVAVGAATTDIPFTAEWAAGTYTFAKGDFISVIPSHTGTYNYGTCIANCELSY